MTGVRQIPSNWKEDEKLHDNRIPELYKRDDQVEVAYRSKYGETRGMSFIPEVLLVMVEEDDGSYVVFRKSTDKRKSGAKEFDDMDAGYDYMFDYMENHPSGKQSR